MNSSTSRLRVDNSVGIEVVLDDDAMSRFDVDKGEGNGSKSSWSSGFNRKLDCMVPEIAWCQKVSYSQREGQGVQESLLSIYLSQESTFT